MGSLSYIHVYSYHMSKISEREAMREYAWQPSEILCRESVKNGIVSSLSLKLSSCVI
jgi:hypothetical protein